MPSMIEIQGKIRQLFADAEEMGADLTPEMAADMEAVLDELAGQEAEKVDGFAFVLREMNARTEFLKDEEKRIRGRRQAAESGIERMRGRYLAIMRANGLAKIKGNTSTISVGRRQSVLVEDEAAVPDDFATYKREVSKTAIKEALAAGREVPGARIVETSYLAVR